VPIGHPDSYNDPPPASAKVTSRTRFVKNASEILGSNLPMLGHLLLFLHIIDKSRFKTPKQYRRLADLIILRELTGRNLFWEKRGREDNGNNTATNTCTLYQG